MKAIQDVIPNKDKVWTKVGWVNVNNVVSSGKKKVFKLKNSHGLEVKTSEDHIFLTVDDFKICEKRLKDFELGESVIVIPGTHEQDRKEYCELLPHNYKIKDWNNSNRLNDNVKFPKVMTEDVGYIIGLIYANGHVEYDKFNDPLTIDIAVPHNQPDVESKLSRLVNKNFNYNTPIRAGDGQINRISIGSKLICNWMNINCILKAKSTNITMPSIIINSPSSVQMAFLCGFFDGDGYASGSKKGYAFATTAYSFVKDMQTVLMSNGIISKIHTENRSNLGWSDLYTLTVTGAHAQSRFVELCGQSIKVSTKKYITSKDYNITPYNAKQVGVKRSAVNSYIPDNGQYLSGNTFLRSTASQNINAGQILLQSEIVSIEEVGVEETFDLVLDEEHLFWCEGYYLHNSGRRGAEMQMLSIHHPEIETFINIKSEKDEKGKNLNKVTGANLSVKLTDRFMQAVKDDLTYTQKFPVDSDEPIIEKEVKARDIWEQIIDAAWSSAEPGLFFIDNQILNSPADIYGKIDPDFISTCSNPCITGDTKIAVADGRGFVDIKTLAEDGVDVPVYSSENEKVVIKTMRNPRVTGRNVDVYKVTLDDGSTFKATANHKVYINEIGYKEVSELQSGDSLFGMHRLEASIKDAFPKLNKTSQNYFWLRTSTKRRLKTEHRLIWELHNGDIPKHSVIHHKDFNSQNNHIDNLECMTTTDHNKLHGDRMRGSNNPIFKIKADPVRFAQYSAKMSKSCSGVKNGNAKSKVSNDDIKQLALSLTKEVERKFSHDEWQAYAAKNNAPQTFQQWRSNELGSISDLAVWAANELGFASNVDAKNAKTLRLALGQGYKAKISNDRVCVVKECEHCRSEFLTLYKTREVSFCSNPCANKYNHYVKAQQTMSKQLEVFTRLKFNLNRIPMLKEWEQLCKSEELSFRLKTKNGFSSWSDLKEQAQSYNHRVVSVEHVGKEDVYNGTVDDTHCFFMGGWEGTQDNGKAQSFSVLTKNCGEIAMGVDSCRLLVVNLYSFVNDRFTDMARFDFEKFKDIVIDAQRLMDDIEDLELECIDKILAKIESDPEPEEVKAIELNMWKRFRRNCENGRRTGLGITGLGDTLAGLGICYGSEESIRVTGDIYKALASGAYISSCQLAKERGAFPLYDYELEKDHTFINRIYDANPGLKEIAKEHGRRNIALTTTAPTGTLSTLTQTSGGIEPAF
ncbi:HNH endonuclease, partial [bacterium]|nr:HNH endonuclease [bacterium]